MWTVRLSKREVTYVFGRSISTAYFLNHEKRAEYPPIVSLKPEVTVLRQELNNHDKIRNVSTIEEKTIGINMPR